MEAAFFPVFQKPGTHWRVIFQTEPLVPLDALRTPYRIDILQPLYYVINSIDDLSTISQMDIMGLVHEAMSLGLYPPLYATPS